MIALPTRLAFLSSLVAVACTSAHLAPHATLAENRASNPVPAEDGSGSSASPASAGEPYGFDELFTGATLRYDVYHSGNATEEHVSPDRLRLEGPWPGSRVHLVDELELGKYFFRVVDPASGKTLFSRGFASIYGEWETTGEAKQTWRTFHESQRFPEPRTPVRLVLEKRGEDGRFHPIHSYEIDPASRFIDRSPITKCGEISPIFENGEPAKKVDFLILGDGYTAGNAEKFRGDAARLVGILFDTEPYKSRRSDFNVRALLVPAAEPGISNPRKDVWRDAPLGCTFNAFDTDRYVLTFANERLREAAAQVPYDALVLVFNERKYGGGGIYNLWATVAADSEQAPYVFVHELGHSFAGLADEYYSSQVAYEEFSPHGVEPWERNVTALLHGGPPKWNDLVLAGVPLPTPWDKAGYDEIDLAYQAKRKKMIEEGASEEASEALMREVKATTGPRLSAEKFAGTVGAFEGAMYEPRGLYRPEVDCIMFTRNPTTFCKVCEHAIAQVIQAYAE